MKKIDDERTWRNWEKRGEVTGAGHVGDGGEGSAFGHGGAFEELVVSVVALGRIRHREHQILRRIRRFQRHGEGWIEEREKGLVLVLVLRFDWSLKENSRKEKPMKETERERLESDTDETPRESQLPHLATRSTRMSQTGSARLYFFSSTVFFLSN